MIGNHAKAGSLLSFSGKTYILRNCCCDWKSRTHHEDIFLVATTAEIVVRGVWSLDIWVAVYNRCWALGRVKYRKCNSQAVLHQFN